MTPQQIRAFVPKMDSKLDLVTLLNIVKHDIYGDKCHDFSLKLVTYYCNPSRATKAYKKFRIPKKSGGFREIAAPQKSLLAIQECLNVIFQALYTPSPIATGFLLGKSVIDNASIHVGMHYVFNTDIKDFFPSISQARVWKLLQLEQYGFRQQIASIVAGLCCMQVVKKDPDSGELIKSYVLPQGSPASPILTNMVCQTLDRRLGGLAKRFNLRCSRYADDITFSSSHNIYTKNGEFITELRRIIEGQNFKMNEPKTRLQRRSERQEVTGVIVSDKVNVNRQYVRDLHSILYIWERYGYDTAFARFSAYYSQNKPLNPIGGDGFMANVIKGKLMYMKMVKGEDDPVFNRLMARFEALCPSHKRKPNVENESELVYTVEQFEKEFNTELSFKRSGENTKTPERLFATARFNRKNICISISNKSLASLDSALEKEEAVALIPLKKKLFIVMKRAENGKAYWTIMNGNPRLAKEISAAKEVPSEIPVAEVPQGEASPQVPDTEIKDNSIDAVLDSFLDSGCDLNILEQWDRTRNS